MKSARKLSYLGKQNILGSMVLHSLLLPYIPMDSREYTPLRQRLRDGDLCDSARHGQAVFFYLLTLDKIMAPGRHR